MGCSSQEQCGTVNCSKTIKPMLFNVNTIILQLSIFRLMTNISNAISNHHKSKVAQQSIQDSVSLTVFSSQLKFVGNFVAFSPQFWYSGRYKILYRCVVVACVKIGCDLMASNGITARRNFHRIWIVDQKTLVKRAPGKQKNRSSD